MQTHTYMYMCVRTSTKIASADPSLLPSSSLPPRDNGNPVYLLYYRDRRRALYPLDLIRAAILSALSTGTGGRIETLRGGERRKRILETPGTKGEGVTEGRGAVDPPLSRDNCLHPSTYLDFHLPRSSTPPEPTPLPDRTMQRTCSAQKFSREPIQEK